MEQLHNIETLRDVETFSLWNFQITILLKAKGLWTLVDGTEDPRAEPKRDAMTQQILITTIDKKLQIHILAAENAREIYEKITKLFLRDAEINKQKTMEEFFTYQWNKTFTVYENISKLEQLQFSLSKLNHIIDDQMLMSKIISILPENYSYFVSAWDSTDPVNKTMGNLTTRLISEEMRAKATDNPAIAFNAAVCYSCSKKGHISRNCPLNKLEKKFCSICKKTNHTSKTCFFREKNKPNKNVRGYGVKTHKVNFMALEDKTEQIQEINFVVDSGSTSHLINNCSLLKNKKLCDSEIIVANSNKITADAMGTLELEECNLSSEKSSFNNAVTEEGGVVIFDKNQVKVEVNGEEVLK